MSISTAGCSAIERLSYDSLGTLLGLLSQVTGTEGIINDTDIPVIMRDVRSLACTSKAMHKAINDPRVLDIFLRFLAKSYKKPPECFIKALDIVGARQWLWQRISQNEHAQTYATIQSIYDLAVSIKEEAKRAGLAPDFDVKREFPNLRTHQTQTGFLLYYDGCFPSIVTPFGKLDLYKGVPSSSLSLLELFIKRLDAVFVGISHIWSDDPLDPTKNRIVSISDLNDLSIRKIEDTEGVNIAENQLQNEKGKQNLVTTHYFAAHSVYKIRKVGAQSMPKLTWPSEKLRYELNPTIIWEMFEKNRLGVDPIAHTKTLSHAKRSTLEVLRTLPEVCEHFFSFVRELAMQPLQEDGSKHLPIGKNYAMGLSLPELHNAAKQRIEANTHWDIVSMANIWVLRQPEPNSQSYGLETLKIAYDQVLSELGANWIKARLKNYPNVLYAKSEEAHSLFVRQPRFSKEARVINCVADKLGIWKYAEASDSWAREPADSLPLHPRPIYLWIQKNKLELVSRLLNLREPS